MYASRALLRRRPPQVSPGARRGEHRWPLQAGVIVALACLPLACGKKGPPLAPLVRIPQPVEEIAVRRIDADVYLRLRVPAQNRDGSTPADVVRVDLFALTADAPPSPETLQQRGTRIASVPIAAAAAEPESAPPAAASQAGVKPGDEVVVRDTLGPAALVPMPPPPAAGATPATGDTNAATTALAADVRRYYMAFAFSGRDRRSAPGKQISVTVATAPPPPADLALTHTPSAAVVTWSGVSAGDTYDIYR